MKLFAHIDIRDVNELYHLVVGQADLVLSEAQHSSWYVPVSSILRQVCGVVYAVHGNDDVAKDACHCCYAVTCARRRREPTGSSVAQIQAKLFHHPANKPQSRPYFGPGVKEAQW